MPSGPASGPPFRPPVWDDPARRARRGGTATGYLWSRGAGRAGLRSPLLPYLVKEKEKRNGRHGRANEWARREFSLCGGGTSCAHAHHPMRPSLLSRYYNAYNAWVREHATSITAIEGAASTATWLLPDRFGGDELGAEAIHSALGLASVYHEAVLGGAVGAEEVEGVPGPPVWSLWLAALQQVGERGERERRPRQRSRFFFSGPDLPRSCIFIFFRPLALHTFLPRSRSSSRSAPAGPPPEARSPMRGGPSSPWKRRRPPCAWSCWPGRAGG